jgi:ABC-2 type transport system permease protein
MLGPISDYSEDDVEKVKSYLEKGNKAFMVASYSDKDLSHYESILSEYGITMCEGVVAESDKNHFYQSPFYLLPEVHSASQTSEVYGSKYVFVPLARGMQIDTEREDTTVTELLTTTEESYVKSDVSNMTSYEKEDGDIAGPFTLGAIVEKTNEDGTASQIAVFTSDSMFTSDADQMVSGANLSVFAATISSFVDHETKVSIPVKSYDADYLTVTQASIFIVGGIMVVLIPILLIATGIVIWIRRRRR